MICESTGPSPWAFCLAPMMQRTDRHFRYLVRLLSPNMRLYTEMVTAAAVVHGDREHLLGFDAFEHPVALQLGGSDPAQLAAAAAIGSDTGYDEINLNCGCPSERVQSGYFGACLMKEPARVADCVAAMIAAVPADVAITVKTRLGVDDLYSYDYFHRFVETVAGAGCRVFHVHARKALLQGLSPRENREIPPLEYDWAYRLKRELAHSCVVLNGGIDTVDAAQAHLRHVDGVMLGRHAYGAPGELTRFDQALFGERADNLERATVVQHYLDYMEREHARGTPLPQMSRHLFNLFHGLPGAKRWRRELTVNGSASGAGPGIVKTALQGLPSASRHARL